VTKKRSVSRCPAGEPGSSSALAKGAEKAAMSSKLPHQTYPAAGKRQIPINGVASLNPNGELVVRVQPAAPAEQQTPKPQYRTVQARPMPRTDACRQLRYHPVSHCAFDRESISAVVLLVVVSILMAAVWLWV